MTEFGANGNLTACPNSGAFFGFMGTAAALVFASELLLRLFCLNALWGLIPCSVFHQFSALRVPYRHCSHCLPLRIKDIGAAYGTAKSGVGISSMGVMRPELVVR